jgi:hypothetical protein
MLARIKISNYFKNIAYVLNLAEIRCYRSVVIKNPVNNDTIPLGLYRCVISFEILM